MQCSLFVQQPQVESPSAPCHGSLCLIGPAWPGTRPHPSSSPPCQSWCSTSYVQIAHLCTSHQLHTAVSALLEKESNPWWSRICTPAGAAGRPNQQLATLTSTHGFLGGQKRFRPVLLRKCLCCSDSSPQHVTIFREVANETPRQGLLCCNWSAHNNRPHGLVKAKPAMRPWSACSPTDWANRIPRSAARARGFGGQV